MRDLNDAQFGVFITLFFQLTGGLLFHTLHGEFLPGVIGASIAVYVAIPIVFADE